MPIVGAKRKLLDFSRDENAATNVSGLVCFALACYVRPSAVKKMSTLLKKVEDVALFLQQLDDARCNRDEQMAMLRTFMYRDKKKKQGLGDWVAPAQNTFQGAEIRLALAFFSFWKCNYNGSPLANIVSFFFTTKTILSAKCNRHLNLDGFRLHTALMLFAHKNDYLYGVMLLKLESFEFKK